MGLCLWVLQENEARVPVRVRSIGIPCREMTQKVAAHEAAHSVNQDSKDVENQPSQGVIVLPDRLFKTKRKHCGRKKKWDGEALALAMKEIRLKH